jgi:hypothetical protein
MFENTAGDLCDSLEKLEEVHEIEDLDQHEAGGLQQLRRLCADFIEAYDNKFGNPDETDEG